MPSCSVGDSLFAELHYRQTKEDLEGVFGDDYEMLDTMDLNTIDIDDVDLSFFETNCDEDSDEDLLDPANWVRGNHDCMLGGQCCNQDSQRAQVPPPRPAPQPVVQPAPQSSASAPSVLITHSANKVVTIQKCIPAGSDRSDVVVVTNNSRTPPVSSGSRSLLLNRTTVQTQQQTSPAPAQTLLTAQPSSARVIVKREFPTPQPSRPETPMSLSESEDDFGPIPIDAPVDNSTSIFRSALDVLTTPTPGVWDCDFLFGSAVRTKDEKPSGASQTDVTRKSALSTSDHDHNYDSSSKNLSLEGLGVDTPSDSEDEEIDVVSLSERSASSRSSSCSRLPTHPTRQDRKELEDLTSTLLSASQAVSRKLKKTISSHGRHRRKRYRSGSSDEEEFPTVHQRQAKRHKRALGAVTQRRSKSSRFGEEEDSQEKRDLHNNMERMRRIDLRNSFEELKALVPMVANKERAAKVVILREASVYCIELSAECQSKCLQVNALRKEQERLRRVLSSLRKAACVSRRR
ncbi:transcriptional regulator Myc-B isoform X2 [Homalodisca vitripennis]|uniref:transcriptional regulator Myc-B isoform X2 n=1 Tax=Homalodisca vitripennis TaxID=197043 RepID=UPI001EEA2846|nr:transcriptional regulator Myc-B isoform X2 [Homalodisca vitripennis]